MHRSSEISLAITCAEQAIGRLKQAFVEAEDGTKVGEHLVAARRLMTLGAGDITRALEPQTAEQMQAMAEDRAHLEAGEDDGLDSIFIEDPFPEPNGKGEGQAGPFGP